MLVFEVWKIDPEKVVFGMVVGGARSSKANLMDLLPTLCVSSELIPGL